MSAPKNIHAITIESKAVITFPYRLVCTVFSVITNTFLIVAVVV